MVKSKTPILALAPSEFLLLVNSCESFHKACSCTCPGSRSSQGCSSHPQTPGPSSGCRAASGGAQVTQLRPKSRCPLRLMAQKSQTPEIRRPRSRMYPAAGFLRLLCHPQARARNAPCLRFFFFSFSWLITLYPKTSLPCLLIVRFLWYQLGISSA